MEKIYALIKNGIVMNTVVAESNFIAKVAENWDYCIRIDELEPRPGVSWNYDGSTFTLPNEVPPE